jgi:hypothetical protein
VRRRSVVVRTANIFSPRMRGNTSLDFGLIRRMVGEAAARVISPLPHSPNSARAAPAVSTAVSGHAGSTDVLDEADDRASCHTVMRE